MVEVPDIVKDEVKELLRIADFVAIVKPDCPEDALELCDNRYLRDDSDHWIAEEGAAEPKVVTTDYLYSKVITALSDLCSSVIILKDNVPLASWRSRCW